MHYRLLTPGEAHKPGDEYYSNESEWKLYVPTEDPTFAVALYLHPFRRKMTKEDMRQWLL